MSALSFLRKMYEILIGCLPSEIATVVVEYAKSTLFDKICIFLLKNQPTNIISLPCRWHTPLVKLITAQHQAVHDCSVTNLNVNDELQIFCIELVSRTIPQTKFLQLRLTLPSFVDHIENNSLHELFQNRLHSKKICQLLVSQINHICI